MNAHRDLDAAVARAYGWPVDISDDDAIERLFALNQSRASSGGMKGLALGQHAAKAGVGTDVRSEPAVESAEA
jgi:hypothetical protein